MPENQNGRNNSVLYMWPAFSSTDQARRNEKKSGGAGSLLKNVGQAR